MDALSNDIGCYTADRFCVSSGDTWRPSQEALESALDKVNLECWNDDVKDTLSSTSCHWDGAHGALP
jgi:hypothetical protein